MYEKLAVPGPDHVLFQAAFANFNPHAATGVNFQNGDRAPLLLISRNLSCIATIGSGGEFQVVWEVRAVTEYKTFQAERITLLGYKRPGRDSRFMFNVVRGRLRAVRDRVSGSDRGWRTCFRKVS